MQRGLYFGDTSTSTSTYQESKIYHHTVLRVRTYVLVRVRYQSSINQSINQIQKTSIVDDVFTFYSRLTLTTESVGPSSAVVRVLPPLLCSHLQTLLQRKWRVRLEERWWQ